MMELVCQKTSVLMRINHRIVSGKVIKMFTLAEFLKHLLDRRKKWETSCKGAVGILSTLNVCDK